MNGRFKTLWGITIGLGLIGISLGLVLRYFFVEPFDFNFKYVLHAHSHLMLLGWLFSALLLLVYRNWFAEIPKVHFSLFLGLQFSVFGMLCTFPFQGYALYSITFSTLHILFSYVLLWKLWKHSRGRQLPGLLVRSGIVFHFLSTLGPYALGPLMANDMRGSAWYDQAIYFYLHFQYNGSFFMILLALIITGWEKVQAQFDEKRFVWFMAGGVVLTWAHSLDFSFDGLWINIAGLTGAVLQIAGGLMLFKNLNYSKVARAGLLILGALALKWGLQIFGSIPAFADQVASDRFLLMAFLHFIFLGIYTPFIWQDLLGKSAKIARGFYWLFFILTEIALVLPSIGLVSYSPEWMKLIFWLYAGLALSWFSLAVCWWNIRI